MPKTISESELADLKKRAHELIANDRQKLVCRYPFIGNVAMKLDIMPIRDARCRTACTDGKTVFFDIAFLSELTEDERLFVFGHEVWHNVMLHFARLQTRDPSIFNIATDLEVNQILIKDGFKAPHDLVFPRLYGFQDGKSAEEYYELLLKKQKKSDKKSGSDNSLGSSGSSSKSQSSSSSSKSGGPGSCGGGSSKSQSSSSKSGGGGSGKLSGQFDKHKYDGQDDDEANANGPTGVKDKYGDVGFDKDFNPTIAEDASEKMREAAIGAAQQVSRMQGTLPAHIESVIEQLRKPEIRWQEVLAQFVTRCMTGEKRQWTPPNRRHIWHDTYLQSRRGEKLNVVVAVDTSGSCYSDLPKFFSEVMSLVKTFGRYSLTLIHTDYAVSHVDEFDDSCNPFPEDVNDIHWHGGGGTSFTPAFNYIEDNGLAPDCFLYFTDGYGDVEVSQPDYPVLWILTKDGTERFCDWGEKIFFKDDSYNG